MSGPAFSEIEDVAVRATNDLDVLVELSEACATFDRWAAHLGVSDLWERARQS